MRVRRSPRSMPVASGSPGPAVAQASTGASTQAARAREVACGQPAVRSTTSVDGGPNSQTTAGIRVSRRIGSQRPRAGVDLELVERCDHASTSSVASRCPPRRLAAGGGVEGGLAGRLVHQAEAQVHVGREVVGLDGLHRRMGVVRAARPPPRCPAGSGRWRHQHVEATRLAQHHPSTGQDGRSGAEQLALADPGHVGAVVGSVAEASRPVSTTGPQLPSGVSPALRWKSTSGPFGLRAEDPVDPPGVEPEGAEGRWRSATSSPRSMGLRR